MRYPECPTRNTMNCIAHATYPLSIDAAGCCVPHVFFLSQDVSKMVNAVPEIEIKEIHVAMEGVFQRMKENLTAEGILPDKLPKRS